jgi:protein ImuB
LKRRTAKSRTADLFAAAAPPPLTPPHVAAPPPPAQRPVLEPLRAGVVPPPPQSADRPRSRQLWYAVVFPALTAADPGLLQRLCLHAQRFTSLVSFEPPNALLLDIKGSLKLFGPVAGLHAAIDACWRELALKAHSATAPSTLAALWCARAGELTTREPRVGQSAGSQSAGSQPIIEDLGTLAGHLAQLPIACTAWDPQCLQTLRAMGVARVGELLRLPRAGLARRLGTAMVRDLDIALARQPAPRRAFVARAWFRERCDFETEIETAAYLQKALEPLIGRCAQFLRERQAGVQTLRLKLRHRERPATRVHAGLASITSEPHRLTEVLTHKLTRLELEAPVRSMELISGSLQPLSAASLDAFAAGLSAGGRDTAPQLVERLRARLGEEAVYGVISIPEHRPEAAWRRVHELRLTAVLGGGAKSVVQTRQAMNGQLIACNDMPRPVWLLDAPLPLAETQIKECRHSGLALEQGPERIESGWWDGKGVARDYYIARQIRGARQSSGARLWVFQERHSKRWYLHGVFA